MAPDNSRMVRGQVFRNGGPLAGVVVRAFGRELRSETLLGEAATDADGRYQINYVDGRAQSANDAGPNLVVRVGNGTEPLVSSPILFRAQDAETVDLVAP